MKLRLRRMSLLCGDKKCPRMREEGVVSLLDPFLPPETPWKGEKAVQRAPDAAVLIVRACPTVQEVREQRFWVSEAASVFGDLFYDTTGFSVGQCATATLLRCSVTRLRTSEVGHCAEAFQRVKIAEPDRWKVIVCAGRETMQHLLMRGGSPPSEAMLIGRPVSSPDVCAPVVYIPNPEELLDIPDVPYEWMRAQERAKNIETMTSALAPLRKLLGL